MGDCWLLAAIAALADHVETLWVLTQNVDGLLQNRPSLLVLEVVPAPASPLDHLPQWLWPISIAATDIPRSKELPVTVSRQEIFEEEGGVGRRSARELPGQAKGSTLIPRTAVAPPVQNDVALLLRLRRGGREAEQQAEDEGQEGGKARHGRPEQTGKSTEEAGV